MTEQDQGARDLPRACGRFSGSRTDARGCARRRAEARRSRPNGKHSRRRASAKVARRAAPLAPQWRSSTSSARARSPRAASSARPSTKRAEILKLQVALARSRCSSGSSPRSRPQAARCEGRVDVPGAHRRGHRAPARREHLRRKGNKITPLILTGQLKSSITFTVEGRDGPPPVIGDVERLNQPHRRRSVDRDEQAVAGACLDAVCRRNDAEQAPSSYSTWMWRRRRGRGWPRLRSRPVLGPSIHNRGVEDVRHARSSHRVAPFRDGPVEVTADGRLSLRVDSSKFRAEGFGTNQLRFIPRESSVAAGGAR